MVVKADLAITGLEFESEVTSRDAVEGVCNPDVGSASGMLKIPTLKVYPSKSSIMVRSAA